MPVVSRILGAMGGGDGEHQSVERQSVERQSVERQSVEPQNHYASLLETYEELNWKHDQLIATREHDMRELSTLRESKLALHDRITMLQRELQACKDDLFRVQPSSQVPDSTITERFESLDARICDWIGAEISGFLDVWQAKHPGAQPKLFHHDGYPDTRKFLSEYPEMGGEYVIRHVIHRHLQRLLFDENTYLFGLSANEVRLLNIIERGMSNLEPAREAATIRTWRSEALASLAKTPEFSTQLQKARNRLTLDIFDHLAVVFPIIDHGQASLDTFYTNVIKPAVELAITIQTSSSSYRFEPRMSSNSISKPCRISRKDLGRFRMTDVETGKTLKPESPVRPDCDGDIGTEMIVLRPGLLRFDADKSVPLSQEAILIKLYHALGRRRAVTVEPEKKDESARQSSVQQMTRQ